MPDDDEGVFGGGCTTVFAVVLIVACAVAFGWAFVYLMR